MPPKGFKVITIREATYKHLVSIARDENKGVCTLANEVLKTFCEIRMKRWPAEWFKE